MSTKECLRRVLLIGASRGIGSAVAKEFLSRGWDVVVTCREGRCKALLSLSMTTRSRLRAEVLDINERHQAEALRSRIANEKFDVLFVCAGAIDDPEKSIAGVARDDFIRLMLTNVFSSMRTIESLLNVVREDGKFGVMSSEPVLQTMNSAPGRYSEPARLHSTP